VKASSDRPVPRELHHDLSPLIQIVHRRSHYSVWPQCHPQLTVPIAEVLQSGWITCAMLPSGMVTGHSVERVVERAASGESVEGLGWVRVQARVLNNKATMSGRRILVLHALDGLGSPRYGDPSKVPDGVACEA
jgi:hypothetical protein